MKKFELTPALKADLDYTVRDLLMAYATDKKLPPITAILLSFLQEYCLQRGYLSSTSYGNKITAKGTLAIDLGRLNPRSPRYTTTPEGDHSLPIRFTRVQRDMVIQLSNDFPEISWHIERLQGSPDRFWRIHFTLKPEWGGDLGSFDGKTLAEVVGLVRKHIERQRGWNV